MIMPSSARKVSGAQFTRTQPDRSLPLNIGTKPSLSAEGPEAQPRKKNSHRDTETQSRFFCCLLRGKTAPQESSLWLCVSVAIFWSLLKRTERMLAVLQWERCAAAREMGRVDGKDHLEGRPCLIDIDG